MPTQNEMLKSLGLAKLEEPAVPEAEEEEEELLGKDELVEVEEPEPEPEPEAESEVEEPEEAAPAEAAPAEAAPAAPAPDDRIDKLVALVQRQAEMIERLTNPATSQEAAQETPEELPSFITADNHDDTLADAESLNKTLLAVYNKAKSDAKAELRKELREEASRAKEVQSKVGAAVDKFMASHAEDMTFIQSDERYGRRFAEEVKRVELANPGLSLTDPIKVYETALANFNALRADFSKAKATATGGRTGTSPAFAPTPGARSNAGVGRAKADDAVTAMWKSLGVDPKKLG